MRFRAPISDKLRGDAPVSGRRFALWVSGSPRDIATACAAGRAFGKADGLDVRETGVCEHLLDGVRSESLVPPTPAHERRTPMRFADRKRDVAAGAEKTGKPF